MAGGSVGLHEEAEVLSNAVRDRHRAISSLMEELEAVDWYDQRVAGASDPELRAILAHNRDEEKEHAAMVIEWLRRNDERFAEELSTYVGKQGPIVAGHAGHGEAAEEAPAAAPGDGSLGIGSLRGAEVRGG